MSGIVEEFFFCLLQVEQKGFHQSSAIDLRKGELKENFIILSVLCFTFVRSKALTHLL